MKRLFVLLVVLACLPNAQAASGGVLDKWFLEQMSGWLSGLANNPPIGTAQDVGEAADELNGIEGDFLPDAYPSLPSDCFYDPDCRACLGESVSSLDKHFVAGEKIYVIMLRTKKKYEMMIALADGAAKLGKYAQYAWALQKGSVNSEMNVAKRAFNQKYDTSQKAHLEAIKAALQKIGQCEAEHYPGTNWYGMYGMPFFQHLSQRWTSVKKP